MNDDLHEPEHDHLLDHEFHDDHGVCEQEVDPLFDDEEDDAWGLLDDRPEDWKDPASGDGVPDDEDMPLPND